MPSNSVLFQLATKKRRTAFCRVSESSKVKAKKNEKMTAVFSYVKHGERYISYEFSEESNTEEENSSETSETITIQSSDRSKHTCKGRSSSSRIKIMTITSQYVGLDASPAGH